MFQLAFFETRLKSNDLKQAREVFSAVKTDLEWHDLAELWPLRATEGAQH